jgi:hypothetical protein
LNLTPLRTACPGVAPLSAQIPTRQN